MPLTTAILEEELLYDGSQIRGQWAYERLGLEGDCAVCFVGGCDVADEHMADLEDRRAGSTIQAAKMLHLVIEHFACDLRLMTTRQRLLSALAAALLNERPGVALDRRGDDLYDGTGKLSVSVAAITRVSGKIHLGLNVTRDGTPVETVALADYGVEPLPFGRTLLERYEQEIDGIERAMRMVRGVD